MDMLKNTRFLELWRPIDSKDIQYVEYLQSNSKDSFQRKNTPNDA